VGGREGRNELMREGEQEIKKRLNKEEWQFTDCTWYSYVVWF
jgi:hypothetical protein